jgi:hypothetical protein
LGFNAPYQHLHHKKEKKANFIFDGCSFGGILKSYNLIELKCLLARLDALK